MTDIIVTIGHELTLTQVVEFPKKIDTWEGLKAQWVQEVITYWNYSPDFALDSVLKSAKWCKPISQTALLDLWTYNESLPDMFDDLFITCFFGLLRVHRKTVNIKLFPHYKYQNLFDPASRKFILNFIKLLLQNTNQSVAIYSADSYGTSIIESQATRGMSMEDLVCFSIHKFGTPPERTDERVKNLFFLYDCNDEIDSEDVVLNWHDCILRES